MNVIFVYCIILFMATTLVSPSPTPPFSNPVCYTKKKYHHPPSQNPDIHVNYVNKPVVSEPVLEPVY